MKELDEIFAKYIDLIERELSCQVYMVGGVVRDALMGREIRDIDLVSSCRANDAIEVFKKLDIKFNDYARGYGVLSFYIEDRKFELATLREDIKAKGRNSLEINFIDSPEKDALRRDFTINALYYNPESGMLDFFDGRDDIKHGTIRFIGDAKIRIFEDPLRILRYLRFAGLFIDSNLIDFETLVDCGDVVNKLSRGNIYKEIMKFFNSEYYNKCLEFFYLSDIVKKIFKNPPELVDLLAFTEKNLNKKHLILGYLNNFSILELEGFLSKRELSEIEELAKTIG